LFSTFQPQTPPAQPFVTGHDAHFIRTGIGAALLIPGISASDEHDGHEWPTNEP
jgi:hypothetical protein